VKFERDPAKLVYLRNLREIFTFTKRVPMIEVRTAEGEVVEHYDAKDE
jgi:hypothetical protein